MDRLVMVTRNENEAEPAVVNTDDPRILLLVLDDGETIALDRAELAAALVERDAA
jgi:hypothetical protein